MARTNHTITSREDGRLRQFNLSLLITREFLRAVDENRPWPLAFPVTRKEADREGLQLQDAQQVVWREWPIGTGYITNDEGKTACKVYRSVPARQLWDAIMSSAYEFAEPGFILVDTYNLDRYYREKVILGPGAFVEIAKDYNDFARAFLRKLHREIAPQLAGPQDGVDKPRFTLAHDRTVP